MSMSNIDLGQLSAAGAGTAVQTAGLGFLPGDTVMASVFSPGGAFAGSAQIQTSPDNSTWTNVGRAVTAGGDIFAIQLSAWVRLNCAARSAGTVGANVFNSIG